jgi:tyrosyl-tRNA synthetase
MPLLEGSDGVQKMSKSLGNAIGIMEKPKEMFGKIMSISDELMLRYYELLTDRDVTDMKQQIKNGENPKQFKEELAYLMTKDFHNPAKAKEALEEFQKVFQKKEPPSDITTLQVHPQTDGAVDILKLLTESGLAHSMAEARRDDQPGEGQCQPPAGGNRLHHR